MNLSDLSPKAEPVAWGTVIAAIIAAAASYGLNITPELKDLLILIGPFIVAGIVARFKVYAPDTVAVKEKQAAIEGYEQGIQDATTPDVA